MGITLKDVKEYNLIDKDKIKFIGTACKCGSDIVFSDSLRSLICTNRNCEYSKLHRFKLFCKELNLSISDNELLNIIKTLNLISPYQLLIIDTAVKSNMITNKDIKDLDSVIEKIAKIKKATYKLSYVVKLSFIHSLSDVAEKVFYGYNSLDEAYSDIESGRVAFLNERLGIYNTNNATLSVDIFKLLLDNKDELIFGESLFNIETNTESLRIVIGGKSTRFINNDDLVNFLRARYKKNIVLSNRVCEHTDILIQNFNTSDNKLKIAKVINNNYVAKCINNGIMQLDDVGKQTKSSYKPIGSKILIGTESEIIDKLDKFYEIQG